MSPDVNNSSVHTTFIAEENEKFSSNPDLQPWVDEFSKLTLKRMQIFNCEEAALELQKEVFVSVCLSVRLRPSIFKIVLNCK